MTRGMDQGCQRGLGGYLNRGMGGSRSLGWDRSEEACEGAGPCKGKEQEGCRSLGVGGYRSMGWEMGQLDRSLEGCKSLEVQASERGYQPGRRQEHERELKTEASLRGGRNREGTKCRSMGGDWQEPGSGRKQ